MNGISNLKQLEFKSPEFKNWNFYDLLITLIFFPLLKFSVGSRVKFNVKLKVRFRVRSGMKIRVSLTRSG